MCLRYSGSSCGPCVEWFIFDDQCIIDTQVVVVVPVLSGLYVLINVSSILSSETVSGGDVAHRNVWSAGGIRDLLCDQLLLARLTQRCNYAFALRQCPEVTLLIAMFGALVVFGIYCVISYFLHG
ncbi:hypothetical protein J6590_040865 [Homalodisca vitripennis]|nr:hypothetical protein J6590_040865 [Homalodisca vitripennis]